ncbi:MAG: bifunctional (p)ppGpp synthetase/guanosine-3',5'-bis(diphosphate) 3'-pyrophosphohydrolase [Chitinophagaceae bacterium]|nr:MAG: bifunctional (p)ppGpp synthetase/guanosine-3',5'-bis(diphosphate) 3'-pyrophosphohydrolase [Chitinophagaceae bacterium]
MEHFLERVRAFADEAHGTQLRKYSPDRYIVHPVRVMELLAAHRATRAQLAAALLHDVLEDTPVTEGELSHFLHSITAAEEAEAVMQLVVELTDVYTYEAHPQWGRKRRKEAEVARMAGVSTAAQTVKYADIIDNTSEIVREDPGFAPKFLKECRALLHEMKAGDAELRAQALDVIRAGFDALQSGR